LAQFKATPDWGAFALKEADMTDAEKLAVLEQRMVELYQELILLEQTNRVYLEMFEEKQDELDEMQSKFIKERNALRAETHKQEGRKHAYKQQAKIEALFKLDGYLMALSEIGNDRDQGRSNQLRGGEDQPQAGQDGDHPDLGHPPK
jgi:hypothetical protein